MSILIVPVDGKSNSPTRPQIGALQLDANITENHSAKNMIPRFPTESGFSVSDAIIREPDTVSLQCIISATALPMYYGGTATKDTSLNRADNAYSAVKRMQTGARLVNVITGLRTYRNMAISSLSIPRDKGTGMSFIFNIDLIEVRIASTSGIVINKITTELVGAVVPELSTEPQFLGDGKNLRDDTRTFGANQTRDNGESLVNGPDLAAITVRDLEAENLRLYNEADAAYNAGNTEKVSELSKKQVANQKEIAKVEKQQNKFDATDVGNDINLSGDKIAPVTTLTEEISMALKDADTFKLLEGRNLSNFYTGVTP